MFFLLHIYPTQENFIRILTQIPTYSLKAFQELFLNNHTPGIELDKGNQRQPRESLLSEFVSSLVGEIDKERFGTVTAINTTGQRNTGKGHQA